MAISSAFSNIKFSTTAPLEDILLNAKIKASIMRRYGYTTDLEYTTLLSRGVPNLSFALITVGTRFSINDVTYNEGELVGVELFTSGDYTRSPIRSIKSEAVITDAIFRYNIL